MKNPLQNKFVVIALVVIAIGCVVGNFVEWPRRAPVPAAARRTSPDGSAGGTLRPAGAPEGRFEIPVRPAILDRLADAPTFVERPGRPDPFAWPSAPANIAQ